MESNVMKTLQTGTDLPDNKTDDRHGPTGKDGARMPTHSRGVLPLVWHT